ncbi:MAG: Tol-Pal system beta propeller repeat protein TolB, partial [Moraxellaceae bacterium]|nr:Tol-Pal system beta propeller repeat protein TolB [Moraxellaceae bacterium]
MSRLFAALLTCFMMLFNLPAQAALTIEITKGLTDVPVRPIAVMNFAGEAAAENLGQIIRNNLSRSGMFNMIDSDRLPAGIALTGPVNDEALNEMLADYLVRGETRREGDNVVFSYEVLKKSDGSKVLSNQFRAHHSRWRDAAHFISDAIYEQITGYKGIFSTRIAYVNAYRRDGVMRYRLELADIDGARRTVLLDSSEPIVSPSWSPDARRLAYISFESMQPQIVIHDLQTGKRQTITSFNGSNSAPAWSPDGRRLAMSLSKDGNPEIYVMDVATRALTRVTNHPAIDTEPRWSPDGQNLLFTSDRSGRAQIYQLNLSESQPRRISFGGVFNARADISQNQQFLALVHSSGDGRYRIGIMNMENRLFSTLTDNAMDDTPSF